MSKGTRDITFGLGRETLYLISSVLFWWTAIRRSHAVLVVACALLRRRLRTLGRGGERASGHAAGGEGSEGAGLKGSEVLRSELLPVCWSRWR